MTTSLFVAPAGAGKTRYMVKLAVEASQDLRCPPRVVLANRAQIRAWRHLLAESGGALGVRLLTFGDLYQEILQAAGEHPVRLPESVQIRIVRALLDETPLEYLSPLRASPALPGMLRDLWSEFVSAGVSPVALQTAVIDAPPRLRDLSLLYAGYRKRLDAERWADRATLGDLAQRALALNPDIAAGWPLLAVDGLDDLTAVEAQVLGLLSGRVEQLVITLTGMASGPPRPSAHKRAVRTRAHLEGILGVQAEALPTMDPGPERASALIHLEQTLYDGTRNARVAPNGIEMIAAPDRDAEVRIALRWLKTQLVDTGLPPGQAALMVRDLEPYRAALQQVAAEYGIPLALAGGLPLGRNPAIASLVNVLRLVVPADGQPASAYPWRQTVDAWRNPYFDWAPLGIQPGDADRLDLAARWGNVVGGSDQWQQALSALAGLDPDLRSEDGDSIHLPATLPFGPAAEALRSTFERFRRRIEPPAADGSAIQACRDHVRWLEELIGDSTGIVVGADMEAEGERPADSPSAATIDLGLARRAAIFPQSGDPVADREQAALATRDVAALNALKDVLRGLVWAEEALQTARVDHAEFVTDLLGAVEGASYVPPLPKGVAGLFVGSVAQARGLVFDAAAVLGLAEGAFPASLREGTFLRDGERSTLNKVLASDLRLGTDSEEGDLFYTAVTRPHRALLLTRPRIADNGAPWQPSPFWEEVLRCVDVRPILVSTRDRPPPRACASWPELWQAIAADLTNSESAQAASAPAARAATAWADVRRPDEGLSIRTGAGVLQARLARDESQTQHEGDLSRWSERWEHVLGPNHLWSVTQLELYGRCPYSYLVARLLRLEPRRTPVEGLDARQIGTLYHRILAELYRGVGPGADVTDLLAHLDEVAQRVLDDAPRREGFRPTAWWQRTRLSMARNLRNTVVTLEQLAPAFQFQRAEQTFGYAGSEFPSLVVQDGEDSFRLGGIVDRIDADGEGALRIVDWKSGDVSAHRSSAVERGDDLQIALYALAVEEALRLGRVAEGLYWSVAHAKPSPFTLAKFRPGQGSGTLSAQAVAVGHAWEAVRRARAGVFGPTPPRGGCPSYCPAVAHCWRYRESGR